MILHHATSRRNLESILVEGLLPEKSRGKLQAVWLHAKSRRQWAVLHCCKRHDWPVEDVVLLKISVPRSWVRRAMRGIWCCARRIDPKKIVSVSTWEIVATSPLDSARSPEKNGD